MKRRNDIFDDFYENLPIEYELKDAEEHREDLTPNTELYYVNRGYVSGIMTALLIIKKGLK